MDSLNVVTLTGFLERPPTIRAEGDTPRCSATLRCPELGSTGSTFTLYVPLDAWGKSAEALGTLHAGTLVAVQGRLCWRKYTTKQGEHKSGLAVLVGKVNVLALPPAPDTS